eukprot:GHUV01055487.1.p1 GENE.GHUV01055487.1~~GHUV01055487.1.p1  ORF type:complete len:123 (-),score=0.58 GHUV01055487.1:123-491(-)
MFSPTRTTRAITLVPSGATAAAAESPGAARGATKAMPPKGRMLSSSSADKSDCVMCMRRFKTALRSLHCSAARSSFRDFAVCSDTCAGSGGSHPTEDFMIKVYGQRSRTSTAHSALSPILAG